MLLLVGEWFGLVNVVVTQAAVRENARKRCTVFDMSVLYYCACVAPRRVIVAAWECLELWGGRCLECRRAWHSTCHRLTPCLSNQSSRFWSRCREAGGRGVLMMTRVPYCSTVDLAFRWWWRPGDEGAICRGSPAKLRFTRVASATVTIIVVTLALLLPTDLSWVNRTPRAP